MMEPSETEAVLASLVAAVTSSVSGDTGTADSGDAQAFCIGGFLWKFPSEGSNRYNNTLVSAEEGAAWTAGDGEFDGIPRPPPSPLTQEYPRKCGQCGVCWVSDRKNELAHLRGCLPVRGTGASEDVKHTAEKLGVARRVWCEIDDSLSRLQWRYGGASCEESGGVSTANCIAFTDIVQVVEPEEPANSFQVMTTDGRTVVFQWRPERATDGDRERGGQGTERGTEERLALDAHQWREYLGEFSRYARDSEQALLLVQPPPRGDEPSFLSSEPQATASPIEQGDRSTSTLFQTLSQLLLDENQHDVDYAQTLESRLHSVLAGGRHASKWQSACDEDGNSLLLLVLKRNAGARVASTVSTLLRMGVDCNLQNNEGESPLLLVAASGDVATANALLATPDIQVNPPCTLGVTAFHAAANAGDVKMLQLLCDAGAEPEIRDENGWTALHYAAACPAGPEALHFLCELLPDGAIDSQCCEGNTALHVASGCGHVNNVRVLLETAADPHMCNANGQSAYHVALQNHHIQCAVAINDYQRVCVANYVEPPPSPVKASVLSEATDVYTTREWTIGQEEHSEESGIWAEGLTEDGHVYYYNTLTGESSWYKPGETQQLETWQPAEYEHEEWRDQGSEDDVDQSHYFSTDGGILGGWTGQQLPLCMIPMVSPLTSLDHPTAASKYESARRKAREQRKQRRGRRLRQSSALEPSSFERLGPNEQEERNERR